MSSLHHIYSIPNLNRVHETRDTNNIPAIHVKRNYFKDSFFPSTISKWIKFDSKVRNSGSLSIFKKCLLNFIRPCANSIFNIHNPYGIKLLTRLHLSLSHLWDHKFRHCFQDTLNPLCDCSDDTETITLFFSAAQVPTLLHRVKSVQIRGIFWSVFSHIRTAGKYGPENTPYLDTFQHS